MDKARQKTDKRLKEMEHEIGRIYENDPALKNIQKEYAKYMSMVQKRTEKAYKDFKDETDTNIKAEKKKAYMNEIQALTTGSKEYNALVKKVASVMANVNQKALDITNGAMNEIYALNYNQVADECKRVGIKVENGKK